MKTLLHICCAPCALMCVESLRAEGAELTGFWYNPNIHPFTEYASRYETLRGFADETGLELITAGKYDLKPFITATAPDIGDRCGYCYSARLDKAAEYAAANGYDSYTSSLLISPYQNHELLIRTAEQMAEKYGVAFLYRDFRPLYKEGQQRAREKGFYMQKYCGCIFSEEERYEKKICKLGSV